MEGAKNWRSPIRNENISIDAPGPFPFDPTQMVELEVRRGDFTRYFPSTPTALCIKECARLSSLRNESLGSPLLDVGCGDGVFAELVFQGLEAWGIDINAHETKLAAERGSYNRVITGDVTTYSLPESYFETCVANCSLEHVPRLDLALRAIHRTLKPGGTFITYVPNRDWAEALLSYRALSALSPALAKRLQRFIDDFFVHENLHDQEGWRTVVSDAGFDVTRVDPVLSSATTVAFEMFLLPSLLGFVNKKVTRRWTNFPSLRRIAAEPAYRMVKGALSLGDSTRTAEFLVVAKKP